MSITSRPEWVTDAVFYQIFPDRFASSSRVSKPANLEPWGSPPTPHGYKGGDLLGIAEHLDWVTDLGANAIYLNPIFQSASNHRYHTHDYHLVDPLLGGDEAFVELLDACHERGIRVVLDGVFNHASRGFWRFNDILENGAGSPWVDWFTIDEFPPNAYDLSRPPGYAAWWNLHALPKFNTENPEVREYLMQVAEHWVRRGIDGWRLDVPAEITTEGFWEEMRERVRAIDSECYLVGEIWDAASDWIDDGTRFDGVMNYPMTEAMLRFAAAGGIDQEIAEPVNLELEKPLDGPEYATAVAEHLAAHPDDAHRANLNLLGSHDTARVLSLAGGDADTVRLATALLLTFPGAPCVYYGDEIGMAGAQDPGSRAGFPWDRADEWDTTTLAAHRELIAMRHAEPALRRGTYRALAATDGLVAFERTLDGDSLVVGANAGGAASSVTLDDAVGERLWGDGQSEGSTITVPSRGAAVWRR